MVTVLMSYHNKHYLLIINKNSNNYSTAVLRTDLPGESIDQIQGMLSNPSFFNIALRRIYAVIFIMIMIIVVWIMMMITIKIIMIVVMVILLVITNIYDNHYVT